MAASHGGYRKPANPAPVSGPGALSQRTDGGPADTQGAKYVSGLSYGEGQALMETQRSAPMAASPAPAPMPENLVPLNAPSQRPSEPVTAGAPVGPGVGPEALGLGAKDNAADEEFRRSLGSYMPVLMQVASRASTSPETRNVIRQLREML